VNVPFLMFSISWWISENQCFLVKRRLTFSRLNRWKRFLLFLCVCSIFWLQICWRGTFYTCGVFVLKCLNI
jgi:hypothetical protein